MASILLDPLAHHFCTPNPNHLGELTNDVEIRALGHLQDSLRTLEIVADDTDCMFGGRRPAAE